MHVLFLKEEVVITPPSEINDAPKYTFLSQRKSKTAVLNCSHFYSEYFFATYNFFILLSMVHYVYI